MESLASPGIALELGIDIGWYDVDRWCRRSRKTFENMWSGEEERQPSSGLGWLLIFETTELQACSSADNKTSRHSTSAVTSCPSRTPNFNMFSYGRPIPMSESSRILTVSLTDCFHLFFVQFASPLPHFFSFFGAQAKFGQHLIYIHSTSLSPLRSWYDACVASAIVDRVAV